MPKSKKSGKGKQVVQNTPSPKDMPSEECKNFVIECIVLFYESETTTSLDSKYVRYQEECVDKFRVDMKQRLLEALSVPQWFHETEKRGFSKFLDSKVHDALWNVKSLLQKYGKTHRALDEGFEEVIMRGDLFNRRCTPFAKKRNRQGSVGWWNSKEGHVQIAQNMRHLIALPDTASIIPVDNKIMRGGYATIQKVRIQGCSEISESWEFAAKKSLQQGIRPKLAQMEHQNESMAVRIGHPGVIRFIAVHAKMNEGYSYWWNGGTLRQMLAIDDDYPENIQVRLMWKPVSEEEVVRAYRLGRWRKKRTELAWALIHIMNAVHLAGHLHNDISPDNIMFHFPEDESRVYIGVCDWGMTTIATEPMQSLYTFTSEGEKEEALKKRWWVDPSIAYVHKRNADVEIIPKLSRVSEEYAIGKIAQRINKGCMSEAYWKKQRENARTCTFLHEEFGQVFHTYCQRLVNKDPGGLPHVINRFCNVHNWPIPDEHFRRSYN